MALALLGGCASSGTTPLGASLEALLPGGGDTRARAEALPYASLDAELGDVKGLLVMGAQAGDVTYWPARDGVVLELADGGLHALQGLETQLLASHHAPGPPWRQATGTEITLTRHLQNAAGDLRRARAEGRLRCEPPRRRALPLGERRLEPCRLALHWHSGETTTATYWRDPQTHRLWAATETPWPDGPGVSWRVARHWW